MKLLGMSIFLCAVLFAALFLSGCNAGAPPQTTARAVFQKVDTPSTVTVTVKGTPAKASSERQEESDFRQEVRVIDTATGNVVKSVPLNGDGTVSVDLPPGFYRIQAYDNPNGNVQLWVNTTPKS